MKLFGFEIRRANKEQKEIENSLLPDAEDGSVVISSGGFYGTSIDLDGTIKSDAELISRYREMSMHPEVDFAINEIVNEVINVSGNKSIFLNLDNLDIPNNVKIRLNEEFQNILNILDFNVNGHDLFRKWYIDGRIFLHVIINKDDLSQGIIGIKYIDPRKIKKIKELKRERLDSSNVTIPVLQNEYFIYSENGFNNSRTISSVQSSYQNVSGIKLGKDSVVFVPSGLTDVNGNVVLSYLHKGIKALNQLRMLEDALVIYRLARAPERRVWYIDVGNLPKAKAEQYVKDIMIKHKNRLIYDADNGEIRNDRKFLNMLEDYWLPRREGGRGTEVTTLPGGATLGEIDDIIYFQKKLFQTLNVPYGRMANEGYVGLGRTSEITRDELRFFKFIMKLRNKFNDVFLQLLEKQVVLKNIMTIDDWDYYKNRIGVIYAAQDNYFEELKQSEILVNRLDILNRIINGNLVGEFFSKEWLRKNILKMSDEEFDAIVTQIQAEAKMTEVETEATNSSKDDEENGTN